MLAANRPLATLTAADLMTQDLVLLPQHLSMRAAARTLLQTQVSGAPVVDAEGRCVGVLSETDVVRWAEKSEPLTPAAERAGPPAEWVQRCMTTDLVTAAPREPVAELARKMIDARVHRVVVLDGGRRPIGVVSGTDILAALVRDHAASEA